MKHFKTLVCGFKRMARGLLSVAFGASVITVGFLTIQFAFQMAVWLAGVEQSPFDKPGFPYGFAASVVSVLLIAYSIGAQIEREAT